MIICISDSTVFVEDSQNPYFRDLRYSFSEKVLTQRFGIEIPLNLLTLSYEPDRNLYSVRWRDQTSEVCSDANQIEVVKTIHERAAEILDFSEDSFVSERQPSKYHTYYAPDKMWEITPEDNLRLQKDLKTAEINQMRDAAELKGFEYLGATFDSDEKAVKRLYGVSQAARAAMAIGMAPTDYFMTWTCQDGSEKPLTYLDAANIPLAMAQTANEIHQAAKALKEQVQALTTIDAVKAFEVSK